MMNKRPVTSANPAQSATYLYYLAEAITRSTPTDICIAESFNCFNAEADFVE
jgi:hypothetical protein